MNTENELIIAQFEREWREQFSTYPPMDTMSREEREKFKEYPRRIWMLAKGQRSYYSW
jgi:hypothetical protein